MNKYTIISEGDVYYVTASYFNIYEGILYFYDDKAEFVAAFSSFLHVNKGEKV